MIQIQKFAPDSAPRAGELLDRHTRRIPPPGASTADPLPQAAGAYVLIVDVAAPVALLIGGRAVRIAPGRYAYCGSARGPGGIAARVGRHLRRGKRPHWHIDRLTEAGTVAAVLSIPDGRECALLRRLLGVPGAAPAADGFGSSDCRTCPTHLVRLPRGLDGAGLAGPLGATLSAAGRLWSTQPVAQRTRATA